MIYKKIAEWDFQYIMRGEGFSYEGSKLLFQIVSDFGDDYELDPVELRCTYSEISLSEAAVLAEIEYSEEEEDFVDEDGEPLRDAAKTIKEALERLNYTVYGDGPFIVVK